MTPRQADSTKGPGATDADSAPAVPIDNAPADADTAPAEEGAASAAPPPHPLAGPPPHPPAAAARAEYAAVADLLAMQCANLGAEGGAVITVEPGGAVGIPAVWPAPSGDQEPPDWLTTALREAAADGHEDTKTPKRSEQETDGPGSPDGVRVVPLHEPGAMYTDDARRHLILTDLDVPGGTNAKQRGNMAAKGENDGISMGFRAVLALAMRGEDVAKLSQKVTAMSARVPMGQLYALNIAAATAASGSAGTKTTGERGAGAMAARVSDAAGASLALAMGLATVVNEHEKFLAAAMATCNELAAGLGCERVCIGTLRGPYVRLTAMSHTEKFNRKMEMVQLIEAAMEECLDQDIEVLSPAPAGAEYVCRSTRELSQRGTPHLAVVCLPLRRDGKVVGAVSAERAGDRPFTEQEVEALRLACDLCTARLLDLRRRDRWVGAKAAGGVRAMLAWVLGARHTWAKAAAVLIIAAGAYLAVATGEYRVDAPFEFKAARMQIVPAPFEGVVESVNVEVGDKVKAGDKLATLRTLTLQRKLDQARAGLIEHQKQADAARSDKKWAEAQMAAAQARQFQEQIALLEEQIDQATVRARIDGTVVRGGLDRFIGSSVEKGQVLFEIAPLDKLRAEVLVPEDQVADLQAAMRAGKVQAELAAIAYPDRPIHAVIQRVLPVAEKVDGQVVFRAGRT